MNKIAVDWSHIKGLATFDGKRSKIEDKRAFVKRVGKMVEGESNGIIKSTTPFQPPTIILESGAPLSLIYDLLKVGAEVKAISNRATQDYRISHNIEKTDEVDAKLIYELSQNGARQQSITLDDNQLLMYSLYNQYCRYQKARVANMLMRKAYLRQFGAGESRRRLKSIHCAQPAPDLFPYDIAIDVFKAREKTLLKELIRLERRESDVALKSENCFQRPSIRGLGSRIWIGILVKANPTDFKCLSAYLRYCGLTKDAVESHKYSRHARMLYHMLAEAILKAKDTEFRAIYDRCKADIAEKHTDYTKGHIHNSALNRTATFLAKRIYRG